MENVETKTINFMSPQWVRTHHCGQVTEKDLNQTITLNGWIADRRDFGQLIFITIRDQYGLIQTVLDCKEGDSLYEKSQNIKQESSISIRGLVRSRPDQMINKDMKSGAIEVVIEDFCVFNQCGVLPFSLNDKAKASEALTLQYRYLELRKPQIKKRILARSEITRLVRNALEEESFTELETPYLYKSTPSFVILKLTSLKIDRLSPSLLKSYL